jgi:pentatricopeptide repeat domain-containing protein 1
VEIQTRMRTSERTWGIIIGGYCREGRLEEVFRCVRQMKDAGVLPNVVIFNTLLKGFLDTNDMAAVDNVSLERNFNLYLCSSLKQCNLLHILFL